MKSRTYPYLFFVGLNLGIVLASLLIGTPGTAGIADPVLLHMYTIAAAVIVIEYPILVRANNWLIRIGIFYSGMVVFLVILGLIVSWGEKVGANEAGTLLALLDGTLRTVFYGHLFGIWFLPIVIFINWLFRRQLFPRVMRQSNE